MKDIGAKLILDILSLTSQGKKLKIFAPLPLTHQEERTGCWSIQYTGVWRLFYKKYFSLHIGDALPANETRRFFIDHRPLKEKKSCVDGVETRIGLTVERGAGNLETRSRIQDRRGLRIRSQWISKIADRNQWGLRMKSQWTSRIEDRNRWGLGIAVTLKSRIDEDWGLLVPHLDEVTSGGRQLTGRFISHHCIGLAFSPSTIREGVKKKSTFFRKKS